MNNEIINFDQTQSTQKPFVKNQPTHNSIGRLWVRVLPNRQKKKTAQIAQPACCAPLIGGTIN